MFCKCRGAIVVDVLGKSFGMRPILVLAVLYACAAAPLLPVSVEISGSGSVVVILREADVQSRAHDPGKLPMFADVLRASARSATREPLTMTFAELEQHLEQTSSVDGAGLFPLEGSAIGTYAPANPAGFIFHEARVGSTLAANS